MTTLIDLLKVNIAFYEFLKSGLPEEEKRDKYFEEVQAFIDQRDRLLPKVTEPQTDEEKRIALTVIDYHKKVEQLLHQNKAYLKNQIANLNKKKVQTKGYNNPYETYFADGVYLDKRK